MPAEASDPHLHDGGIYHFPGVPGEGWWVIKKFQQPNPKQIPITQFSNGLKRHLVFFGIFGHWNLVISR
jgi:hypothetical protein